MRHRWVLAGLGLAFAGQAAPQQRVMIDLNMLYHLEMLAESSQVETARCIVGKWEGDVLELQGALDAPYLIIRATPDTVATRWWECPSSTVALWHAHIWNYWVARGSLAAPWERCALSPSDRAIARDSLAPAITLISVKRGVTCVWIRLDQDVLQPVTIRREP